MYDASLCLSCIQVPRYDAATASYRLPAEFLPDSVHPERIRDADPGCLESIKGVAQIRGEMSVRRQPRAIQFHCTDRRARRLYSTAGCGGGGVCSVTARAAARTARVRALRPLRRHRLRAHAPRRGAAGRAPRGWWPNAPRADSAAQRSRFISHARSAMRPSGDWETYKIGSV